MRFLYSLLWWIALPFVLLRLYTRGKKEPGYRQHVGERLSFYDAIDAHPCRIWVHAVSVGETRAAEPLIRALLQQFPEGQILLTCMTPTGRETGKTLFQAEIEKHRLVQAFLPYDMGMMMRRFIKHFQPCICILLETEIWPNLIAQCRNQQVPLVLANARLSERSLKKGKKIESVMRFAATCFDVVAAQTQTDASRLSYFSDNNNIHVTGSVKFDIAPPQAMVEKGLRLKHWIGNRTVFMCASTRQGEEPLILSQLAHLNPDTLVLLVPRHPQRFDEVEQMLVNAHIQYRRRSQIDFMDDESNLATDTRVLLGDSMGEMFMYYSACDIAFVGGSIVALGGQNLIEPCAVGKPVLIGKHTFNFEAITEDAVSDGCATRVHDAADLMAQANRLLDDVQLREKLGAKASAFAHRQTGATNRTMALITPLIQHKLN